MPDDGQLKVRGIAAIGAAVAGIITAGAIGGGDAVVVGLVVFFGLGLAWLVLEAQAAGAGRAHDAGCSDQSAAPITGSIGEVEAGPCPSSELDQRVALEPGAPPVGPSHRHGDEDRPITAD